MSISNVMLLTTRRIGKARDNKDEGLLKGATWTIGD
jgi:hypothetical protein